MSRRRALLAVLLPLALLVSLFVAPATVLGAESTLLADLTGDQEVPVPGDPDGFGGAAFFIDPAAGTVCWDMFWEGIDTPTAAHIHAGSVGVPGDVVVALTEPFEFGCVDSTYDLQAIVNSPADYYVNIHNADYPGGAIRGQFRIPPTTLFFELDGSAEVPGPGDPDGDGGGYVDVFLDADMICYFIDVQRISAATAAHIHVGPAGVAGGVVIPLDPPVEGFSDGCVEGLEHALLQAIVDNPAGYYVNVHNDDYPAGALRGQLQTEEPAFPTLMFASLSGAAEVPGPGDPRGGGWVEVTLDPEDGYVCVFWSVTGIESATAAHIHTGETGVAGPVLITLPTPGENSGPPCVFGLEPGTLQGIVDNPAAYYVNVHNHDFPAGAVRGQLSFEFPEFPPCAPPDICDGLMAPGDYEYRGFTERLSFTTTEEWFGQIFPEELFGGGFGLIMPDFSGAIYAFAFTGNVGGGACGEVPTPIENSAESLATWLSENPQAGAGPVTEVTIGGVVGYQVDTIGTLSEECAATFGRVFLLNDSEFSNFWLAEGEQARFILLDVGGQTIILILDDFTGAPVNAVVARAQPLLDSIVWGPPPGENGQGGAHGGDEGERENGGGGNHGGGGNQGGGGNRQPRP